MGPILAMFLMVASPSQVPLSKAVCEAASLELADMRYRKGGYAEPGDFSHPEVQARISRCREVVRLAEPYGVEMVFIAVAVTYQETNFRKGLVGAAGEVGMMQVRAKYHCTPFPDLNDGKGGCTNPELAGVRALLRMKATAQRKGVKPSGLLLRVLKTYNGGMAYARKVSRYAASVRASYLRGFS